MASEKVTPYYQPIALEKLLNGPPTPWNDDQTSVTARLLVDCRCQLGECVIYDNARNCILFESILDRTFHRLNLSQPHAPLTCVQLPKYLCAFALLETNQHGQHQGYLAAWEGGFQLYDLEKNQPLASSYMSQGECVNPLGLPDRLNDGRVDPTGKYFICGGCAGNPSPLKVYKCWYDTKQQQLFHTPILDSIRTTNSICWSNNPDDDDVEDDKNAGTTTMYLSDSPTLQIHQYDYRDGEISNKRPFHEKPCGFADGSCVDAQGYVWNATWRQGKGTGMVQRIDPHTGKEVFTVHLPDTTSEASCCCLGGPNFDILFITTAWEHLDPSKEVHAGGLYAVKLPNTTRGLPEKRFKIL